MKDSKTKPAFDHDAMNAATTRKYEAMRDIMLGDIEALDPDADNADLFLLGLASSQEALAKIVVGNIISLARADVVDSEAEKILLKGADMLNRMLAAAVFAGLDGGDDESDS